MPKADKMDVQAVLTKLNRALCLQYRSALQYLIVAAGGRGPHALGFGDLLWSNAQADAVDHLIGIEEEAVSALHEVIPDTGQEPHSEALEHLVEHLIMRNQAQLDALVRARM